MRVRIDFRANGKPVHCLIGPAETGVSFRDIPQDGGIAGVEFFGLFEIRDRVFPVALPPGNGAGSLPGFGIVRSNLLRDGHLRPGQLVIAVAIIIVVGQRQPRLTRVGPQTQGGVGRYFCQREALPCPIAEKAHAAGALVIAVFTEAVSLGLVTPPGEMVADIVVGEGQSFGNALSYGGPYVGLFATRQKYVRQMPGRLVGETVDAEGKRGFVLTLSTREQHIRREKATSNICTNSGLCTLAFSIHLTLLGEAGLRRLARVNHANAVKLAVMLAEIPGVEVLNKAFFNEFTIRLPVEASSVVERMFHDHRVLGGLAPRILESNEPDLRDLIIVASTEVNTDEDRAAFAKALREVLA